MSDLNIMEKMIESKIKSYSGEIYSSLSLMKNEFNQRFISQSHNALDIKDNPDIKDLNNIKLSIVEIKRNLFSLENINKKKDKEFKEELTKSDSLRNQVEKTLNDFRQNIDKINSESLNLFHEIKIEKKELEEKINKFVERYENKEINSLIVNKSIPEITVFKEEIESLKTKIKKIKKMQKVQENKFLDNNKSHSDINEKINQLNLQVFKNEETVKSILEKYEGIKIEMEMLKNNKVSSKLESEINEKDLTSLKKSMLIESEKIQNCESQISPIWNLVNLNYNTNKEIGKELKEIKGNYSELSKKIETLHSLISSNSTKNKEISTIDNIKVKQSNEIINFPHKTDNPHLDFYCKVLDVQFPRHKKYPSELLSSKSWNSIKVFENSNKISINPPPKRVQKPERILAKSLSLTNISITPNSKTNNNQRYKFFSQNFEGNSQKSTNKHEYLLPNINNTPVKQAKNSLNLSEELYYDFILGTVKEPIDNISSKAFKNLDKLCFKNKGDSYQDLSNLKQIPLLSDASNIANFDIFKHLQSPIKVIPDGDNVNSFETSYDISKSDSLMVESNLNDSILTFSKIQGETKLAENDYNSNNFQKISLRDYFQRDYEEDIIENNSEKLNNSLPANALYLTKDIPKYKNLSFILSKDLNYIAKKNSFNQSKITDYFKKEFDKSISFSTPADESIDSNHSKINSNTEKPNIFPKITFDKKVQIICE